MGRKIAEWRVVHMDAEYGFDRVSSEYPTREMAEKIQRTRGGVIQRRFVTVTKWREVSSDEDD